MTSSKYVVVHLEDSPADQTRFRRLFDHRLRGELRRFFEEHFRCVVPSTGKRPEFQFELEQYATVDEFCSELIEEHPRGGDTVEHRPTEVGRETVLFVLDYYVPRDDEQAAAKVETDWEIASQQTPGGIGFSLWLERLFPHVPVVLLTKGGPRELSADSSWSYMPKGGLENEELFARRMRQLLPQWWDTTYSRKLEDYAQNRGAQSWHTPGHNAGEAFCRSALQRGFYDAFGHMSFQSDLSVSVDGLGDLSEPDEASPLKDARDRSASIFGSEETFYITNGTSTSNKSMLMTLLRPGEVVLLDRNCHKSVHQAVVMSGAVPVYMTPPYNQELGVWPPLSMPTLMEYIHRSYPAGREPRMLILTSCTYEGVLYPLDDIRKQCERNGILLYADEAWAPYLRFHPFYTRTRGQSLTRYNATDGGAHFAVQSTHKALAAFSQASMIHVSKKFRFLLDEAGRGQWGWLQDRFRMAGEPSYGKFRHELFEVLRYWHSTSPHYPMLATLDRSGVQMRLEGMRLIDERLRWVRKFEENVAHWAPGSIVDLEQIVGSKNLPDYEGYLKDPLKIVLALRGGTRSRDALKTQLDAVNIQWEKSTYGCVQFLVTVGTFLDHIQQLEMVIQRHRGPLGPPEGAPGGFDSEWTSGQPVALPRDAAACDGEMIELSRAGGRVCAQMVVPYPPGIPVMLPGLRIHRDLVPFVQDRIREDGAHSVHGIFEHAGDHYIKVVSVDEEEEIVRNFEDLRPIQ